MKGIRKDVESILKHVGACTIVSIWLCTFQDTYVWYNHAPSSSIHTSLSIHRDDILGSATRGMGQHYLSMEDDDDQTGIPTYNDIMYQHRTERVMEWKTMKEQQPPLSMEEQQQWMDEKKLVVLDTLKSIVDSAKPMAMDYGWEELHELLQSDLYNNRLLSALQSIRQLSNYNNNNNLYKEDNNIIGYDWGSCAWRSNACGAQADYQEARAELNSLVGMLEPFECQFILDVMERSLRDVLNSTPSNNPIITTWLKQNPYKMYESVNVIDADAEDPSSSSLDQEYLKMLEQLRSQSFDDESGDITIH